MSRIKTPLIFFLYALAIIIASISLYCVSYHCGKTHLPPNLYLLPTSYPSGQGMSIWEILSSRVESQPFNLIALAIFWSAILHIFFTHKFTEASEYIKRHNKRLGLENPDTFTVEILRFLGEVEVVFGVWTIPLLGAMTYYYDWSVCIQYLNARDYTEPMFVVVIMLIASTKPIVYFSEFCLRYVAKIGNETVRAWWWSILTIGPLLGSFITEPAAMTISAVLIGQQFYKYKPSTKLAYATVGLLFTNISVGGVLTNFAAPPVLMVSKSWGWDATFMIQNFGWKAILGILIANICYYFYFRKEFHQLEQQKREWISAHEKENRLEIPLWIILTHIFFLAWVVVHAHYPVIFLGSFLLFVGMYVATMPYQNPLNLRTPILVGFFLAGLVIHGTLQSWWITPLIHDTTPELLMFLSTILTAFNDNAEVTFLASLIPTFDDAMKYAVVTGAVTGGGLTVIANAPNLPGQALLNPYFKDNALSFVGLFLGALTPTVIIGATFYLLRNVSLVF